MSLLVCYKLINFVSLLQSHEQKQKNKKLQKQKNKTKKKKQKTKNKKQTKKKINPGMSRVSLLYILNFTLRRGYISFLKTSAWSEYPWYYALDKIHMIR